MDMVKVPAHQLCRYAEELELLKPTLDEMDAKLDDAFCFLLSHFSNPYPL